VDLTAGTTPDLGRRTTLAATVPVTSGFNMTFDRDFQARLNYSFAGR
jgi:hypothetical protein